MCETESKGPSLLVMALPLTNKVCVVGMLKCDCVVYTVYTDDGKE